MLSSPLAIAASTGNSTPAASAFAPAVVSSLPASSAQTRRGARVS
uniref:Uncharacterized protein n=1 Tax=Arundo donax TaxID=35708 RepID=A0A0A9C0M4_ARUDO